MIMAEKRIHEIKKAIEDLTIIHKNVIDREAKQKSNGAQAPEQVQQ